VGNKRKRKNGPAALSLVGPKTKMRFFFLEKIGIRICFLERIFCMEEIQKDILSGDFSIIQKSNIYLSLI
jgi:hypothetical protein